MCVPQQTWESCFICDRIIRPLVSRPTSKLTIQLVNLLANQGGKKENEDLSLDLKMFFSLSEISEQLFVALHLVK